MFILLRIIAINDSVRCWWCVIVLNDCFGLLKISPVASDAGWSLWKWWYGEMWSNYNSFEHLHDFVQHSTQDDIWSWLENLTLCNLILIFLLSRPQTFWISRHTSSTLVLNTGAPQGFVLSPLLFTLYTHECTHRHQENSIVKYANNTTIIGRIINNDEGSYQEGISNLLLIEQNQEVLILDQ